MPSRWTIPPDYVAWVQGMRAMDVPETCMAYSLSNAARMASRAVNPRKLLTIWEDRSICIPGSTPVIDPQRALRAAESYLKESGMTVTMNTRGSTTVFPSTFGHAPQTHVNPAHVITLGPTYMRAHHDTLGERIAKRSARDAYSGPGHDVLVLGMEADALLIHDPDPQLKEDSRDPRFEGAPVVHLERAYYRNYFASGDHARTLTAVAQLLIKPKDKPAAREKGQRRLMTGDE